MCLIYILVVSELVVIITDPCRKQKKCMDKSMRNVLHLDLCEGMSVIN